jgi:hypothetical protein
MVETHVIQLQSGHILGVNIQAVMALCNQLKITGEKLYEILEKIKFIERMGVYSWLKRLKKEKD